LGAFGGCGATAGVCAAAATGAVAFGVTAVLLFGGVGCAGFGATAGVAGDVAPLAAGMGAFAG
jgi:hypothetical protein